MLRPDDLDALDDADLAAFRARQKWLSEARQKNRQGKQIPPADPNWEILLFRAGRGFGKTKATNEFLWWEAWRTPGLIGHVIAPTMSDVRGTSFEGPAGLCSLIPAECLKDASLDKAYNKTHHELRLGNGSLIRGFGAVEEAGRLRGPQAHAIAADELREWDRPAGNLELALTNALFGLRLPYPDGTPARAVLATTPKPIPFLKRLEKRPGVRIVTGTSYENLENLSSTYRSQLLAMAGTLLGRQEIDAAYIDEESDQSIVKRHWINLWPAGKKLPEFMFILEAYDTATSEHNFNVKKQETDPSGSIVLGVFNVAAAFSPEERKKLKVRGKYGALLCDAWTERLGFPDLLMKAREQHRIRWGTPGRKADIVLIEDKSSGPSLRQTLGEYGIPCWPYNPHRMSKTQRLHAASPTLSQGALFVPESMRSDRKGLPRDWVEPFLEQICAYSGPGTTEHDEFVDTLSMSIIYLKERGLLEADPQRKFLDAEEEKAFQQAEANRVAQAERKREKGNPYA